ncbi:hypothetical protein GCM10027429_07760 [Marivirga atlantica]|jgi:hypothetical protein|uniref:Aryl-sulfate sulfotransferase n=1 Tax=Marivirga atlantica TaxID=1548457 RepID=A0A937ACY6_9BACT|nr:aryl-sulfate sulfotransferase [Marivirga atlantica]MBL0764386.1 aryl-sulfate sulfotransferase [Marivirga atlantica]
MRLSVFLFASIIIITSSCERLLPIPASLKIPERCNDFNAVNDFSFSYDDISSQTTISFNTAHTSDLSIFYQLEGKNYFLKSGKAKSKGSNNFDIEIPYLSTNSDYKLLIKDEAGNCLCKENYNISIPYKENKRQSGKVTSYLKSRSFKSFILTHDRNKSPKSFFLLNEYGHKVWNHEFEQGRSPKVFSLSKENHIIAMLGDSSSLLLPSDEIVEIDFNNGVEQRLKYGEHFKKYLHHDIKKVNGNYHAITYDTAIVDLSSIGGSANQEVIGDGIIVLSENGELLWEWSVFDVRSPLTDPAILKRTHDWLHMNSLTIDADGNYYLSFRNTSEIWKVDGSTGDLLYSYTDDVLSGQHSMELINQEQLILFNNSLETNQSSALIYKISQGQISNLMYQTPLDQSYFSYVMGSAYLNDNNLLFCSTSSSSILLTDFNGNIEWKYEDGFFPFRAYSFKPKEFNFTRYYE